MAGYAGALAGRATVRPVRTQTPPDVDGRLDDAVWRDAARVTDFVQRQPTDGAPATEATDVYLAYDSSTIYLAFHAHYTDPSMMRANRADRDQAGRGDDLFTVYFDPFLDQQRAYSFSVNGYGVQGDSIVTGGRGGGGGPGGGRGGGRGGIPRGDSSWDALFSTGGQIVEDGFTAEMAIPLKSLRYPTRGGDVPHTWGFQIARQIRGKDETVVWSPYSRDISGFLPQMGVLDGMTRLSTSRNLEIQPTFTAFRFGTLDEETGRVVDAEPRPEAGANFKYGVTSNLTADFTVNPDFSQIESDRPQVEVNQRFALFFPELRPFFLEGAEIFRIQAPLSVVHTRTIVDPLYGAKLTGKAGKTTIGVLYANDEAPGAVDDPLDLAFEKSAQTFVGRVRYDLYSESFIGAVFTDREFLDGSSRLAGLDSNFRLGDTSSVGFRALRTDHRDEDGLETDGYLVDANFRQRGRKLSYGASAFALSPDFKTDVGFVRRTDQRRFNSNVDYEWRPEHWIISWGPESRYGRNYNFAQALEDENFSTGVNVNFARNIRFNADLDRDMERYEGINFEKRRYGIGGGVNTSRVISFGGGYNWGDEVYFDEANPFLGRESGLRMFINFRPVSRFSSNINITTSRFRDPNGFFIPGLNDGAVDENGRVFDVNIFRALSTYQFTDRLLFRNITEFDTFDQTLGLNILLTYRVNSGTAFYFGYDDHYQQREQFDDQVNITGTAISRPTAPSSPSSSIFFGTSHRASTRWAGSWFPSKHGRLRTPAMPLIVSFPGAQPQDPAVVGGKGYWLIRMAEAGLPIPPGAVLTTEFFSPWFDELQRTATWTRFTEATPDEWATVCPELKELCLNLPPSAAQRATLSELRCSLRELADDGALLAVRSSSPEEDRESASFAGGYETRLGVRPRDLEDAIRRCMASSLDHRVFAYKASHGFDVLSPRIAVVVQAQVDSDVAGVGFSLNPLTNDYDEVVIDANWGLGESVVSGFASPDHFVVSKVTGHLVERTVGRKQVSIWLDRDGGTTEREGYRSTDQTLTETQLAELTRLLCRIEDLSAHPTDVEWAYGGGGLHLLQARPITTYVPLPPEMLTNPGERRRLYADAAISKGLTTNQPISPLGLAWIEHMYSPLMNDLLGMDFSPAKGLVFAAGGRLYMNVSNFMWLGMSTNAMAKNAAQTDALLGQILANIDPEQHRAPTRPPWLRLHLALLIPKLTWMARGFFWSALRNLLTPKRAWRAYERRIAAFEKEFKENIDYDLPLREFARTYTLRVWQEMGNVTMPALLVGLMSPEFLMPKQSEDAGVLAQKLRRGFTGNLVVEQGIALFRLAHLLDRADFDDIIELAARIEKREMPAEFLSEWDAFLRRFGCRGPHEMDVASPRYADDPTLALEQMSSMPVDEAGFNPEVAHRRNVEERRSAYEELLGRSGWLRRAVLRRIYRLSELFGGTRDTPKYHAVMLTWAVRKRALIEGRRLVTEGRLDLVDEVFDLTLDDLEEASRDTTLDLRRLCEKRTRFAKQLAAHVTEFPQVIDSRGRIFRPPPRQGKASELIGMAVSPGTVTGPVKVLRNPRDKSVEPGNVIVAYTTDPGWTPLFVNAAAVVLEVGGVLQHGAVIAREYGKPCVVGIDRVMTKLHDGQIVEVDGTAGVVRLVS